ncbi:MAG: hypothetical protein SOZ80_07695 [Prevotella sp.]|uniref:hypothetical protein n=1 Tax=Prevotella sp. TaxID=59823 RepID=UPI002A2B4D54|nr:hypothetical protein [Prevotella sp.]MDD7317724.1 hypothetical protein [Prevotellaceae bacterium]MDY4020639.1 hypothetical protein [Prevotella sp.]
MKIKNLLPAMLLAVSVISCNDNDEPKPIVPPSTEQGSVLFAVSVTNAEGNSGSVYLQAISNLDPATYDNKNSVPTGFGALPIALDNGHIYSFPDYMGSSKAELKLYKMGPNNKLVLQGTMGIPGGAAACNVVELNSEKAYLSCQGIGMVIVFNPSTMKEIKKIDLSKLAHEGTTVSPAAMIIRDNYLYVGLSQFNSQYMPTENSVELALINTNNDQYEKTIRNESLGVSVPTRPVDSKSIFMDEKGDIYISCMASFGLMPGFNAGIIRIKKGETEIDPDYCIRLDKTEIKGLSTKYAEYLGTLCYDKGGKLYAYANSYKLDPEGASNPYTVICQCPVVIDIYNKTIERIEDMPISNPHGIAIGKYKNLIVFGSANRKCNGFYTYDPETKKSSDAIVKVQGFPCFFHSYAK